MGYTHKMYAEWTFGFRYTAEGSLRKGRLPSERITSLEGEMMACYIKLAYEQGLIDAGEILKKCGLAPYGKEGQ